jgi:hypothetical protein
LVLVCVAVLLTACGGGGDGGTNPKPQPVVQTGVFVDSLVAGVNYATASQQGVTNSRGEFNYLDGERVTFSIGGIVLGTADAGPVVTALMLVNGANDVSDPRVTNIIRLLISLDSDANPGNGINISPTTHTAAAGMSLDFSSATFDTHVQALLEAVNGADSQLVDAGEAQTHFNTTIKTSWGTMTWGTDCWNQVCP